jgi:hypothetical protein
MDNDNEMIMELLMQEGVDTTAVQEQRMMVLTALLCYQEQLVAIPRWDGSRVETMKNKNQHRLDMLFCLTQIILWMRQQIPLRNSGVILDEQGNIHEGCVWSESLTTNSCASQIARDYMGSHPFRNARLLYGALRMEHHVIRVRTNYA